MFKDNLTLGQVSIDVRLHDRHFGKVTLAHGRGYFVPGGDAGYALSVEELLAIAELVQYLRKRWGE